MLTLINWDLWFKHWLAHYPFVCGTHAFIEFLWNHFLNNCLFRRTVTSCSSLKRELKSLIFLIFNFVFTLIIHLQCLKLNTRSTQIVIILKKITTSCSFKPSLLNKWVSKTITTAIATISITYVATRILSSLTWGMLLNKLVETIKLLQIIDQSVFLHFKVKCTFTIARSIHHTRVILIN